MLIVDDTLFTVQCNCDAGEEMWTLDEGTLTDLDHLPVTKLNFGSLAEESQEANFLLGPLFCHGGPERTREVSSCEDIWRAGDVGTGYHMIKGHDTLQYNR